MRFRPLILLVIVSCMLVMQSAVSAAGPAQQPAHGADLPADATGHKSDPAPAAGSAAVPPAAHSQLDSEPIRRTGDAGTATSPLAPHPQSMELPRVAGALVIVLGLIFALRWGAKKFFVPGMAGKSTRAVQVLSRSSITPRQHILLLRVGRRVIVVGEAGSQMNSLAEITDPDEIASLLGQLQDEKSRLPTKAFQAMFSRARSDMGGGEGHMDDADAPATAMTEESDDNDAVDPAISETREDITGLMDKIRVLSKHFRGGAA